MSILGGSLAANSSLWTSIFTGIRRSDSNFASNRCHNVLELDVVLSMWGVYVTFLAVSIDMIDYN